MALRQFTLTALSLIEDEKAVVAFDRELQRIAEDCSDRPTEKKPRKVSLIVEMVPATEDSGECDRVEARFQVTSTIPARKTRAVSFGLRQGGMLTFNPDSPYDVNQGTLLPDDDDDEPQP